MAKLNLLNIINKKIIGIIISQIRGKNQLWLKLDIFSFKKKIKELINFQFDDCKIIDLTSSEIKFVIENRNNISHGEDFNFTDNVQDIYNKIIVLIFYSIWKELGFSSSVIKNNVAKSFSSYYHYFDKKAINEDNIEKISLKHKNFNKISKYNYEFCVIEKNGDKYFFNERYTKYLRKDIYNIRYYSEIKNLVYNYYHSEYIINIEYKQGAFFVIENNQKGKKYINQYFLVSIKDVNPDKSYKLKDSLIPDEVYKISQKNNISLLKVYRKYNKFTLDKLAEKTQLSKSTIIEYEKGKIKNMTTYWKILKALGTDLKKIWE